MAGERIEREQSFKMGPGTLTCPDGTVYKVLDATITITREEIEVSRGSGETSYYRSPSCITKIKIDDPITDAMVKHLEDLKDG
jgi:hypothetical protein